MGHAPDPRTSATLLGRLRQEPVDPAAWRVFVERYGARIYEWCRAYQLQHADAEDVTQDVLRNLVQRLQSFVYDPSRSFRGWLKTLTHHAWADFVERQGRQQALARDGRYLERLQTEQAAESLLERLDAEFERDALEEALNRVQRRVTADNWEAFCLLAFEEQPGPEVAARLGKTVAAIYMARSRITQMLRKELDKLNADGERGV